MEKQNAIIPRPPDDLSPLPDTGGLTRAFLTALDIKASSRETYERALKQFFLWLKGTGKTNPDRASVLEYKESLRARGLSAYSMPFI